MTVISDSYMGMFLPSDIPKRISKFIEGASGFPFVDKDEIMGIFFLFGKNFGVRTQLDILSVKDLAKKSIDQIKREIFLFKAITKSNIEIIKENYQKRILQIYVEYQNNSSFNEHEINERIIRDPTILMSCYSQHISYYNQKCFFEIFNPLKKGQIDKELDHLLVDRMVMLSYNREHSNMLPFNTIIPFLKWIKMN